MKDKEKKKQLKLSENLVEGEDEEIKEIKPKKEKEKPANKLWIVLILIATVVASLFFKFLSKGENRISGVNEQKDQIQTGGYAF